MKRIVIKVGTQVIVNESGFRIKEEYLREVVRLIATLWNQGKDVVLVSSGAVALGRAALKLEGPLSLSERQACAAIGQSRLIQSYDKVFSEHGISCAQILVTAEDLASRRSYLHLKETFSALLGWRVVPIVNENDSVSTAELEVFEGKSFGDNDVLSALIATKLGADLMVLLTSVDGIFVQEPIGGVKSERLGWVQELDQLNEVRVNMKSALGRGGMTTKLEAVRLAALCGVSSWIGRIEEIHRFPGPWVLSEAKVMAEFATLVAPVLSLRGRKKWIGGSAGYKAILTINAGAAEALLEKRASLLAVGVVSVNGDFKPGDIVSVRDEGARELGRGIVRVTATELLNSGLTSKTDEQLGSRDRLGDGTKNRGLIAVHRDDLALFVRSQKNNGS
jgi:glutamate 5-kinase